MRLYKCNAIDRFTSYMVDNRFDEWVSLVKGRRSLTITDRSFIFGVKRETFIKSLKRNGFNVRINNNKIIIFRDFDLMRFMYIKTMERKVNNGT